MPSHEEHGPFIVTTKPLRGRRAVMNTATPGERRWWYTREY